MAEDDILKPADGPISVDDEEPIALEGGDEPLSLVDSEGTGGLAPAGLTTIGMAGGPAEKVAYKRSLNANGTGATRCRVFHTKIAIAPLENMEKQINEWLDGEEIEIKHVGHLIGTMEGKRPEPNLLVLVWY